MGWLQSKVEMPDFSYLEAFYMLSLRAFEALAIL